MFDVYYYLILPWICHFIPYWCAAYFYTLTSSTIPDTKTLLTNLRHTTINFWAYCLVWFSIFSVPITEMNSTDIIRFAVSLIVYDIIFYHLHRLFHFKLFYRFHAVHHEWSFPIPISALDCSVIEYWVLNLFPAFASLYLCRVSYYTSLLASVFFVVNAVIAHSEDGSSHSYHHLYRTVNYGTLGLMDRLYRTKF